MTDANFLYYHINADNLIYWKDLDANEGGELQLRTSEEIKALHVRDGVVYYIMNTSVLSFDLSQKITDTVLTAEGTQKIGTVHSPISLAFRGENLLVADSGINAVQSLRPRETETGAIPALPSRAPGGARTGSPARRTPPMRAEPSIFWTETGKLSP